MDSGCLVVGLLFIGGINRNLDEFSGHPRIHQDTPYMGCPNVDSSTIYRTPYHRSPHKGTLVFRKPTILVVPYFSLWNAQGLGTWGHAEFFKINRRVFPPKARHPRSAGGAWGVGVLE